MGIYLGQLPPAEIARLKAELAETLIANFCYPRFFDYRTEALRMRPVDRAKRQEVWLYLSSVDFTAWSRLDLMSPEFQRQIERLFILFVQRNRSFFGEQGRKRMADIRMLIGSSSTTVVQGLRNHVSGQRQGNQPFGSPRPVVSWSSNGTGERPEPGWEQISASTMQLQQQLQEVRGEIRPQVDGHATNGAARRTMRGNQEFDGAGLAPSFAKAPAPTGTGPLPGTVGTGPLPGTPPSGPLSAPGTNGTAKPVPQRPAAAAQLSQPSGISAVPTSPALPVAPPVVPATPFMRRSEVAEPARKTEPVEPQGSASPVRPAAFTAPLAPAIPAVAPTPVAPATPPTNPLRVEQVAFVAPTPLAPSPSPTQSRTLPQPASPLTTPTAATTGNIAPTQRDNAMMLIGDDDIAIFEQMRHQLMVWLRVEAVRLGLDITGQGPSQLLELLRQQSRFDETRLQVVSTLLNLANQIIKNGQVSVIDYKQALMFHLMHTRQLS